MARASTSSSSLQSVHSTSSPSASSSTTTADTDASIGEVRGVRFDERCVLIPQGNARPARLPPRIGTLEVPIPVALPWRRPGSISPPAKDTEFGSIGLEGALTADATRSQEVQQVILKVPYPIFRRKSHSTLPASIVCPRSCLRHSVSQPASASALTFSRSPSTVPRRPKRRSHSLPPLPLDPKVETVPLRPCCEKCLAACERHRKTQLSTLEESSREHSPSQSRLDLLEGVAHARKEEDWCAGLHFTKGAMKLWRSASADHVPRHVEDGSGGFLGSLVSVDEVDRKRGSSPNLTPRNSISAIGCTRPNEHLSLDMRHLERVKKLSPPSGSPAGSEQEEDLFPLPSPKRSPAASPADSATCLPAQVAGLPPTEPRRLEAAVRAKITEREKAMETSKSSTSFSSSPLASSPIDIPGMGAKDGNVSHFRSHLEEIEWDPTLPDPDELPPDSTILLNSPPGSPSLGPSRTSVDISPRLSSSTPALSLHLPEVSLPRLPPLSPLKRRDSIPSSTPAPSLSRVPAEPAASIVDTRDIPIPPIPEEGTRAQVQRPAFRRASISNIMRASVSMLRGLSLSGQTGQSSPPGPATSMSRGLLA